MILKCQMEILSPKQAIVFYLEFYQKNENRKGFNFYL
jgi:hypothetical protein